MVLAGGLGYPGHTTYAVRTQGYKKNKTSIKGEQKRNWEPQPIQNKKREGNQNHQQLTIGSSPLSPFPPVQGLALQPKTGKRLVTPRLTPKASKDKWCGGRIKQPTNFSSQAAHSTDRWNLFPLISSPANQRRGHQLIRRENMTTQ